MARFARQCISVVFVASSLIGGIVLIGNFAREQLRTDHRCYLPFSQIECQPSAPPGMSKADFLDEVQYLANFPKEICIFETDLSAQLAAAFAQHPWVEAVERIHIEPPKRVTVFVVFRVPTLIVPWRGAYRAVDRHGILLPRNAPTSDLQLFSGDPGPPLGPAGQPWGNEAVARAAKEAWNNQIGVRKGN